MIRDGRARVLAAAVAVAAAGGGMTGCGADHVRSSNASAAALGSPRHEPTPTRTVIRHYRTQRAGQTGILTSRSQHASLRLTAGRPMQSSAALSSYGDPPRYGHYLTFRLTITNTGSAPILVRRLDFWLKTPGTARTTTDDGNAPFSGAAQQLDTTQLPPGHRISNDLTFDVAGLSGTLFYGATGHPQLAWAF